MPLESKVNDLCAQALKTRSFAELVLSFFNFLAASS